MNILIVEDEPLLGLLLADALTDVGHHVLGPASCRAQALELCADCLPDLAVVDVELRGRDSGIDLARDLRQRGVPCLFATGQASHVRDQRELAIGLVAKPYSPMTIIETLRYFESLQAGLRLARPPKGLEVFAPGARNDAVERHEPVMLAS